MAKLSPQTIAAYQRAKEAARKTLDDCSHPDCVDDRARTGYASCAGGHLARSVVKAIAKVERGHGRTIRRPKRKGSP